VLRRTGALMIFLVEGSRMDESLLVLLVLAIVALTVFYVAAMGTNPRHRRGRGLERNVGPGSRRWVERLGRRTPHPH
jgi:hypothetical protein